MCEYFIKGVLLQDIISWGNVTPNSVMSKSQIKFEFTTLFHPIKELR